MVARFSQFDLETLADDLGIGYENLKRDTKEILTRELLAQAKRQEKLSELLDLALQLRPDPEFSLLLQRASAGQPKTAVVSGSISGCPRVLITPAFFGQ